MRVKRRATGAAAAGLVALLGTGTAVWFATPDRPVVLTADPAATAPASPTPATARLSTDTGRVQCNPNEAISEITSLISTDRDYSGPVAPPLAGIDHEVARIGAPLGWSRSDLRLERGKVPEHVAESVRQPAVVIGSVNGRRVLYAIMVPVPDIPPGWDSTRDTQPTGWIFIAEQLTVCVMQSPPNPNATMPLPSPLPPDQWPKESTPENESGER